MIADYLDCSVDFILGRTETSRLVKDILDEVIEAPDKTHVGKDIKII